MVCIFKQHFSVFKQHFTYFNALFHPHVFSQIFLNNNFQFLNIYTKRVLGVKKNKEIFFFPLCSDKWVEFSWRFFGCYNLKELKYLKKRSFSISSAVSFIYCFSVLLWNQVCHKLLIKKKSVINLKVTISIFHRGFFGIDHGFSHYIYTKMIWFIYFNSYIHNAYIHIRFFPTNVIVSRVNALIGWYEKL